VKVCAKTKLGFVQWMLC